MLHNLKHVFFLVRKLREIFSKTTVVVFRGGVVLSEDERRETSRELEEKFDVFRGLFLARTVVHSSGFGADNLGVVELFLKRNFLFFCGFASRWDFSSVKPSGRKNT